MQLVHTTADLRHYVAQRRGQGQRIALVPTMGALHAGHLSLVSLAQTQADIVIVTIFVNPKQFAAGEDLDKYPRTLEADCAKLKSVKTDLVFAPNAAEMYPSGFATNIHVAGVSEGLCGAARPGHFDGVATVVTKLLLQALPDIAVFGEKDYQQLAVIRRLVADLNIPVEIIGAPIMRDDHGLALSSRNAYLSAAELTIARQLNGHLFSLAKDLKTNPDQAGNLLAAYKNKILSTGFDHLDYLELRDAYTLQPVVNPQGQTARIFVAAHVGSTRLIDNIPI